MSSEAIIADEALFERSMKDVRSDSTDIKYLIAGHVDNNPHSIEVKQTGSDVSQMNELLDDTQVMYVLARLTSTFDLSTTIKFVYIHWIGTKVPFSKKGRFGVVHRSVQQHFKPYHLELETDSTDDVTKENMLQKLDETSGTISKVRETSEIQGIQERGFTQTQIKDASSRIPGKSSTSTKISAVSSQGASVTFAAEVAEGVADVRLDDTSTNWLLAGYEGGNPKSQVVVVGSGTNGLSELKELLSDDLVLYGLLRVGDEVDEISTVKFVYITWVGTSVKPMTKAKATTHKGVCNETFLPAHVTVFASEQSDLIEEDIMNKVQSASGTKSNVRS